MRVLIIKLSSLGDIIHCLPSLEAIKMGLPQAQIDWAVEEENAEILEAHPYIDRLIVLRRKAWIKRPWRLERAGLTGFFKELRSQFYDLVLDFQGLFKSGLLAGLSKGGRKIGFDRVREMAHFFYNEKVPLSTLDQHAVTRYLEIPGYLGINTLKPRFFLPIHQKAIKEADNIFKAMGLTEDNKVHRRVFINPNARWQSKQWPWECFRDLVKGLSSLDYEVILTGGPNDRIKIADAFQGLGTHIHNAAGRTSLIGLAAMFKRGDCLVTNDSGPMHLAVAVGLPVVALFGPTNPVRTGPFGWQEEESKSRVLFAKASCSPCYNKACKTRICLSVISVDQVLNAVQDVLDATCLQG